MAELAVTLPRNDTDLLEKLITAAGQAPFAKQASTALRFTPAEWRRIAAAKQ
jgi:hypothetical protein